MLVSDKAFIIKKTPFKETSLILNVLSRNGGLQSFVVKGALRPKSPFLGILEFLNEVEIYYNKKENTTLYTLFKADLIRDHFSLASSSGLLMDIGFLVQLTRRNIPFNEPVPALYQSFYYLLRGVEEKKGNKALLYYFLTLIQEMGLSLHLSGACSCGAKKSPYFNPENGSFYCEKCQKGRFVGEKMAFHLKTLADKKGKEIEITSRETKTYFDVLKEYLKFHK
ncbi:MAG TPA: DNA repair protein RecO [Firmicutes bacterium]|nr:DNA repair protein RecO [Bacillota bacterium]